MITPVTHTIPIEICDVTVPLQTALVMTVIGKTSTMKLGIELALCWDRSD